MHLTLVMASSFLRASPSKVFDTDASSSFRNCVDSVSDIDGLLCRTRQESVFRRPSVKSAAAPFAVGCTGRFGFPQRNPAATLTLEP